MPLKASKQANNGRNSRVHFRREHTQQSDKCPRTKQQQLKLQQRGKTNSKQEQNNKPFLQQCANDGHCPINLCKG